MFKKLAGFAVVACLFMAGTASAQISSSAHNFSGAGWSGGKICIVCHAPHPEVTQVSDAPLWNHELSVGPWQPYTNPSSMDATMGDPSGISLLCLSCHDGSIAMDNYGGTTTGSTFIGANGFLDTDLTDDHPVSISYALDTELAPSTNPSGVGTTGNDIATDMLFAGNVECASCHDVHNKYGIASLLKKDNAASALCQTCHAK